MLNNFVLEYYNGDSIIHKLSSVCKIISLFLMISFLVMANSIVDMVIINLYMLVMVVFSDISFRIYYTNVYIVKYIILILTIVVLCVSGNIYISLLFLIKVIDFIIFLSIICMTSSVNSIIYGINELLRPINKTVNTSRIALRIGLFSKFVSIYYNEKVRIKNSMELRGVYYSTLSIKYKVVYFFRVSFLICRNTLNKIKILHDNMIVRNYGYYKVRNNYRLNKFGKTDTIFLCINAVILFLLIVY